MPKTTIGKGGLKFESAHILGAGYEGKCSNIHGHNYKVRVELTAAELDRFGMVADFSLLKPVQQWLDDHLDHALILNGYDHKHQDLGHMLRTEPWGFKVQFIDGNPTAEVLAAIILDRARKILGGVVYAVTVWENDEAYARVTIDLNEDADYVDANMARALLYEEMAERKLGGDNDVS